MAANLIRQSTGRTLRKVKAAAWTAAVSGGAASVIVTWLEGHFPGYVTPEVRMAIGTVVAGVITGGHTWAVGYFVRERGGDHPSLVEAIDAALEEQAGGEGAP